MRQKQSFEQHAERNETLRQNLKRVSLDVRDVMRILGYRSTSAALYELRAQVKLGLVEYEPPKEGETYGKYYLAKQIKTDSPSCKLPNGRNTALSIIGAMVRRR